jgi:hypothetical protein
VYPVRDGMPLPSKGQFANIEPRADRPGVYDGDVGQDLGAAGGPGQVATKEYRD